MVFVWLLIGLLAAWGFACFACSRSPEIERRIMALGLIIAGLIYCLFAIWFWQPYWLGIELLAIVVSLGLIYLSFRYSIYWLVFAWAIHPFWDLYIHLIGPANFYTPTWYPVFCLSFDLFVAVVIVRRQLAWKKLKQF